MSRAPGAVATEGRQYGGRSPQQRRADRRRRLLDAGFGLFGTVGFSRTTIASLCDASGVTERHFYEDFDSREALLREVYLEVAGATFAVVYELLRERTGSRSERILRTNIGYFEYLTADERRARIYAVEIMATPDLQQCRHETRERFIAAIADGVERLHARGIATEMNAALVAAAIAGAAHELVVGWLLAPCRPDARAMAQTVSTMWCRSLLIAD